MGQQTIRYKPAIKYLGEMVDNRLQFKDHASYTSKKASQVQAALSRILPNIGAPKYIRRLLLSRVVSSVLLYAAQVWTQAMMNKGTRRKLASDCMLSALWVMCGYRTISEEATLVIAGMLPFVIMVDEMARIYDRRAADHKDHQRRRQSKIDEKVAGALEQKGDGHIYSFHK